MGTGRRARAESEQARSTRAPPLGTPSRPLPHPHLAAVPGPDPDLVVVSEQLSEFGGTERVLDAVLVAHPGAEVVALGFTAPGVESPEGAFAGRRVRLVGPPVPRRHFLAPLYARRIARTQLPTAPVVLSLAHHGWSLAAPVAPGARHVSYLAGPSRALHDHTSLYLQAYGRPARALVRAALPALRAHNRRLALRPDRLLANSSYTADRIAAAYHRAAEVLYPPVRTGFFTPASGARGGILAVARLVPHKRLDVLVDAFAGLEEQLVVVGTGPLMGSLRERATSNVHFAGFVGDEELRDLYRTSRALVCPSVEDFGIVMAEALSAGTPVIAPRAGGAREIVVDGETGVLLPEMSPRAVAEAVRALRTRRFAPAACRAAAERFSEERFVSRLREVVAEERTRARDSARPRAARRRAHR